MGAVELLLGLVAVVVVVVALLLWSRRHGNRGVRGVRPGSQQHGISGEPPAFRREGTWGP
ncbi:MAG: hypothetical protein GC157_06945 [Frankiales bacterium]|nr:hypothetical protein [Frankiales bacterium]